MRLNKSESLREILRTRRSIRSYKDKDISEDDLQKILEAGWFAPSAGNRQPVEYIIVRDDLLKQKLSVQQFVGDAPVVVVVFADTRRSGSRYGERAEERYLHHDSGAAIQNMLLMVNALGLGSCWIGAFNDDRIAKVLDIPQNMQIMALLPIGYPNEEPTTPRKIPIEKIIHENKYKEKDIEEHFYSLVD